jgi:undecaprenyl-diphosphatase
MDMILEILRSILLGLIHGVGEVLPVSGRGHVVLFLRVINADPDLVPMILLSAGFGTMLALLHHFRTDLANMAAGTFRYVFKKDFTRKADMSDLVTVLIASTPVVILSLFFRNLFPLDDLLSIGFGMLVSGVLLIAVFRMKDIPWKTDVTTKDSAVFGLFQVFALFPGLSRVATLVSAGLFSKIDLKKTVRFALLVHLFSFTPLLLFSISDVNGLPDASSVISCAVSIITGFIGAKGAAIWMLKSLRVRHLNVLGWYVGVLGLFAMILYMTV